MKPTEILNEINNSTFQYKFEFTNNIDSAVDNLLKIDEDYFLNLNNEVKELIQKEIEYAIQLNEHSSFQKQNFENSLLGVFAKPLESYEITFEYVCRLKKEIFEHKIQIIEDINSDAFNDYLNCKPNYLESLKLAKKANNLLNKNINLELRNLKEMCFPLSISSIKEKSFFWLLIAAEIDKLPETKEDWDSIYLLVLEDWYKVFQKINFFGDFNHKLGGIIINIFSYLITGKYLILCK